MRTRAAAICLLLLSAPLAACGGGGTNDATPARGSGTPTPSRTTTWDCSPDSDISQADWAAHCQGVDNSTTQSPSSSFQTVALGQPYEGTAPNDTGSLETITIKGLECGLSELPDAAANPAWDGSEDIPENITATADPGMTFCRITASWQNTGKVPIVGWTDFENLVTADGTEFAKDTKAEAATQTINHDGMPSQCSPLLCISINPGTAAFDIVKIYHVPAGTQPTVVRWPHQTIDSGPVVEFALT